MKRKEVTETFMMIHIKTTLFVYINIFQAFKVKGASYFTLAHQPHIMYSVLCCAQLSE